MYCRIDKIIKYQKTQNKVKVFKNKNNNRLEIDKIFILL